MGRAQRQVYHLEIRVSSPPPRPLPAFPLRSRVPAPWLFPLPSGRTTFRSSRGSTPRSSPPPEEAAGGDAPFRAVRAARGGPSSRIRGLADSKRMQGRSPRAFSLEAHLSSGAGVILKSVSVTHRGFTWEEEGARGKGVRVGSLPILLRTRASCGQNPVFVRLLPSIRDDRGLEAVCRGPVGRALS